MFFGVFRRVTMDLLRNGGGLEMCIPGILIYRNKSYTTGILMRFFLDIP